MTIHNVFDRENNSWVQIGYNAGTGCFGSSDSSIAYSLNGEGIPNNGHVTSAKASHGRLDIQQNSPQRTKESGSAGRTNEKEAPKDTSRLPNRPEIIYMSNKWNDASWTPSQSWNEHSGRGTTINQWNFKELASHSTGLRISDGGGIQMAINWGPIEYVRLPFHSPISKADITTEGGKRDSEPEFCATHGSKEKKHADGGNAPVGDPVLNNEPHQVENWPNNEENTPRPTYQDILNDPTYTLPTLDNNFATLDLDEFRGKAVGILWNGPPIARISACIVLAKIHLTEGGTWDMKEYWAYVETAKTNIGLCQNELASRHMFNTANEETLNNLRATLAQSCGSLQKYGSSF